MHEGSHLVLNSDMADHVIHSRGLFQLAREDAIELRQAKRGLMAFPT